MTKFTSHVSLAAALLAGFVLSACGASTTADPTDTTPQAETNADPVAQNEQNLQGGEHGRHGGRGRHGKHDPEKLFARMDKDGDGKILIADLPERIREHLAKADADKDGALTRDELKAAHEARKAEWLKKVDTNGDGTVSDEEKAAARAKFGHGPGGHGHHHDDDGPGEQ